MSRRIIPEDINVEILLNSGLLSPWQVHLVGTHRRNATGDIDGLRASSNGKALLSLGRNSIYDTLPEVMFHPIDRFDSIPESHKDELFANEVEQQERERENARLFFQPVDIILFQLRLEVRQKIERLFEGGNVVLQHIIGDRLTVEEQGNRFVRSLLPLLPYCRTMRGNRTLITLALRKAFELERITLTQHEGNLAYHDNAPRYNYTVGGTVGDCYLGNEYDENIMTYSIHYWDEVSCDGDFDQFLRQIEVVRVFVEHWFLAIDQQLCFDISTFDAAVRLDDDTHHYHLNYNTNL